MSKAIGAMRNRDEVAEELATEHTVRTLVLALAKAADRTGWDSYTVLAMLGDALRADDIVIRMK